MPRKKLDHFQTYEWRGTFWFLDSKDVQFNGTVTYSPENGLKIDLLTENPIFRRKQILAGKVMHGIVQGEDLTYLTLFDVFLSVSGGNHDITEFRGSVLTLLQGFHFTSNEFSKIEIRYEKSLENIFLRPSNNEVEILRYNSNPHITIEDNIKISLTLDSWGQPIFSEDEIDTLFWANDAEKFKLLKQSLSSFIQDEKFELTKRTSLIPIFRIEIPESSLQKFFTVEYKWRSFWELILGHVFFPINIWLQYTHEPIQPNTLEKYTYNEIYPILQSQYKFIKNSSNPRIFHNLPITIFSFGSEENDLSLASQPIKKWFQIRNDPKWAIIIDGIDKTIRNTGFVDTARYVALVSDIETFLNVTSNEQENIDSLIKLYAKQEWIEKVKDLLDVRLSDVTIGQFFQEIRNVITHPKASGKANGKYWSVVQDKYLLQKCFAYLAGLFIKAILEYLGEISDESITKYVDQFIQSRASFTPIEFMEYPLKDTNL